MRFLDESTLVTLVNKTQRMYGIIKSARIYLKRKIVFKTGKRYSNDVLEEF